MRSLWRALAAAHDLPAGAAQIVAAEQVVRRADAAGDAHLRFAARLLATRAYVRGGAPVKAYRTFLWCRTDAGQRPARYHRRYRHTLLWQHKTLVGTLAAVPEVPLARVHALLDDLEERFTAAGHSVAVVHEKRHLLARATGDTAAAAFWYERWVAEPRDALSDCAGCAAAEQVAHLAEQGRDEEAIALVQPVLAGDPGCSQQPQGLLTALLLPYARTGRLREAAEAHLQAYRALRPHLADLGAIAAHITFCASTGNLERGREILERHLGWLEEAPTPGAALRFAVAGALVLHRLEGDAGLAGRLAARATALAARFDARDGSVRHTARVAAMLAADPLVRRVPLGAAAGEPAEEGLPERITRARAAIGAGRFDAAVAELVEAVALCAEQGRDGEGARLRVELVEACLGAGRWREAAEAGEEALLLLRRTGTPAETTRCRLRLAAAYRELGDEDDALAMLDQAVTELTGAGDDAALGVAHETAGDVLYQRNDDAAAALRYTTAAAAYQRAALLPDEMRALRRALAAWRWADEPDSVLATLADADRLAAGLPATLAATPALRWELATLGREAARALLDMDRPVEALVRITGVAPAFRSIEAFAEAAEADLIHGDVLLDLDRPEDAEPLLRSTLAGLPRDADEVYSAAWRLVRALAALGRDHDATALRVEYGFEEDDVV